jgi:hypothetical protein
MMVGHGWGSVVGRPGAQAGPSCICILLTAQLWRVMVGSVGARIFIFLL